jgi:hypothetical protein
MASRLPASMRTREELMSLIEKGLSTASAKDELVTLVTRLFIEKVLEGGGITTSTQPGQGYWNGYRTGRACGAVPFGEPRASEGTHAGSRGAGDRDAGAPRICRASASSIRCLRPVHAAAVGHCARSAKT